MTSLFLVIIKVTKQKYNRRIVIAMSLIITYFLTIIQYQAKQISWLLNFIAKYIPLKQWAFDDSHSPKYQKFKTDKLPKLINYEPVDYQLLLEYYKHKYNKIIKPVSRRKECDIPDDCKCPRCNAPKPYIYKNNGSAGQFICKICQTTFHPTNRYNQPFKFRCPYCSHSLIPKKNRKHFTIHKCVNPKCPYYIENLKKVDKLDLDEDYGKNKYKLHYIYREFTFDYFKMDLDSLPPNASSLKFRKHTTHVMGLCLTLHVNLGLSLRKTSQALKELYNIQISHTAIANMAKTAAVIIKPFVDNFDYPVSEAMVADETYTKVRGVKGYVWFIMDFISRSIIGYQVSDNRGVGPCILAMRMALRRFKKLPENFRFIADGYSAYPLAAQQFALKVDPLIFNITQVIGLANDDEISTEFRPYKQLIERLNRTFKESYRVKCGYDNFDGANYSVALWVAYYNFLRPHKTKSYQVLNHIDILTNADNMPGKWQLLIHLGQQTILSIQKNPTH